MIRPLRVCFVITSMPVGGAETLLVNLVRRLDRTRFAPQIVCLKEPGPLGEILRREIELTSGWLRLKWDVSIVPRLAHHFRSQEIDSVITVGAGDKMFWGRLGAKWAGVPMIASALHSTGWPDGVGRLNRLLTGWTDAFIAVAENHGRFLVDFERFPKSKVVVIPNGIDTERFRPNPELRRLVRQELSIPETSPLIGIVAALRPEKNHELFLNAAHLMLQKMPQARFVIVGDGPQRSILEGILERESLSDRIQLLGTRSDTERILASLDLFALTSHNEANPVSILESLSCGVPVVATNVGSVKESVIHGKTGFLIEPGNAKELAERAIQILSDPHLNHQMGKEGRTLVLQKGSLDVMVAGYEDLIETTVMRKREPRSSQRLQWSCQAQQTTPTL